MTGHAFPGTETLCTTISPGKDHTTAPAEPIVFRHQGRTGQQATLRDVREMALMYLIKSGNFDARQKLITDNLRMVLESNRRYANNGVGIFDLLNAGKLGLIHALEAFEPESDGYFSEYAALCIRQHVELVLHAGRTHPAAHKNTSHTEQRGTCGQRQCA